MVARKRHFAKIEGPSRTKQSMKDSCDINLIMGKYLRTGTVDHLAVHGGSYGFASAVSLQEAMNIVLKAESMFADLSSGIRKKFDNSPKAFLEFVQARDADGNLKNLAEMRQLGLAPAVRPEPTARDARIAELEVDREARLELARRAVVAPPAGAHTGST